MIIFILSILAIFISVHFILIKKKIIEGSANNNNKCTNHGGLLTEPRCKELAANLGFDVSNKAHYDNTAKVGDGYLDGCQLRNDRKKIFFAVKGTTENSGEDSSFIPLCGIHYSYSQIAINAAPPVAESNDKCKNRGGDLTQTQCLQYAKNRQYEVTKEEQYKKDAQAKNGFWNGCQISSEAGKKPKIWFAAKDTKNPAKKYGSDATSTAICKNDFMGVSQTTAKTCNLKNCVAPFTFAFKYAF